MKTIRLMLVLASPALLAGCAALAIPPALSIASYAGDGASYLATGKSLTDHAISDAMSQDCAMHRVIRLKYPCRDFTYREERVRETNRRAIVHDQDRGSIALIHGHYGATAKRRPLVSQKQIAERSVLSDAGPRDRAPIRTQVASLGKAYLSERRLGAAAPDVAVRPGLLLAEARPMITRGSADREVTDRNPFELAPLVRPTGEQAARLKSAPRSASIGRSNTRTGMQLRTAVSRFVVFGSFRSRREAARMAQRHPNVRPAIVASRIEGRTYYRVVAPAVSGADARRTVRALKRAGVRRPWTISACPRPRAARTGGTRCLAVPHGRLVATDARVVRPGFDRHPTPDG